MVPAFNDYCFDPDTPLNELGIEDLVWCSHHQVDKEAVEAGLAQTRAIAHVALCCPICDRQDCEKAACSSCSRCTFVVRSAGGGVGEGREGESSRESLNLQPRGGALQLTRKPSARLRYTPAPITPIGSRPTGPTLPHVTFSDLWGSSRAKTPRALRA